MNEEKKKNILEAIFEHYWWNVRGFSYRVSNDESIEREVIASALEPFLENNLRKGQSKVKVNVENLNDSLCEENIGNGK